MLEYIEISPVLFAAGDARLNLASSPHDIGIAVADAASATTSTTCRLRFIALEMSNPGVAFISIILVLGMCKVCLTYRHVEQPLRDLGGIEGPHWFQASLKALDEW
jgi:hypothetical protein